MIPYFLLVGLIIFLIYKGAGFDPGTMYLVSGIIMVGLLFIGYTRKSHTWFRFPLNFFYIILTAWLIISILPIPKYLHSIAGERRLEQHQILKKILLEAHSIDLIKNPEMDLTFSRNRMGTANWVILLVAAIGTMGISSYLTRDKQLHYIRALVLIAVFISLAGIIGRYLLIENSKLSWFLPGEGTELYACFVNKNNFGGFLVLLCPAAIFLCAKDINDSNWFLAVLNVVCFFIMTTGVIISMSRGAFFTYIITILAVVLLSVRRSTRKTGIIICLISCISFAAIICFISGTLEQRLRTIGELDIDTSAQIRLAVWKDGFKMWKDYPLIGVGAEGFRMVFSQYRSIASTRSFHHAENIYLQLILDTGLFGLMLIAGSIVSYVHFYKTIKWTEQNSIVLLTVICAIISACVHALIDVALFVPLYLLVLSSLLGLPLGLTDFSIKRGFAEDEPDIVNTKEFEHGQVTKPSIFSVLFPGFRWRDFKMTLFTLSCLILIISIFSFYRLDINLLTRSDEINSSGPETIKKALVYAPTYWHAWYNLGRLAQISKDKSGYEFGDHCFLQAAVYNPTDYRMWKNLYEIRSAKHDIVGAEQAFVRMMDVAPKVKHGTLLNLKKHKPLLEMGK